MEYIDIRIPVFEAPKVEALNQLYNVVMKVARKTVGKNFVGEVEMSASKLEGKNGPDNPVVSDRPLNVGSGSAPGPTGEAIP